ncbi:Transcriptional regulatory protein moc3 [Vanrija pseudolonga]|uniref:Transcriptional regulatory protein moc3 n=1 Tax=Vanrija pseudolonga TaxID=143232 RepID=A0AAF1BIT7_9TREE|nr:Transcriptional regulatory protein moc3 [Vanrija pseudolonga]
MSTRARSPSPPLDARKRPKTFTGCFLCRKRKVKCGEERPQCHNCTRRPGRVCAYPDAAVAGEASPSTAAAAGPSTPAIKLEDDAPRHAASTRAPYLSQSDQLQIRGRMVAGLLASELPVELVNPYGTRSDIADTLIGKLLGAFEFAPREMIQYHALVLRRNFDDLDVDPESRLVCSTIALFAAGGVRGLESAAAGTSTTTHGLASLHDEYLHKVRAKTHLPVPATGKLASASVTLFLNQLLERVPGKWRDQVRVNVDWSMARGGPGWILGITPPITGYTGERRLASGFASPLALMLSADFNAILSVFASLIDGSLPTHLTTTPQEAWPLEARELQMKIVPALPDFFETMVGMPRILLMPLARAVGLVSRSRAVNGQALSVREQLEHDVASLRLELEAIWPARLAARQDERRIQYGARIWRLAILVLLAHQAQGFATTSADVRDNVGAFIELCTEAVADLGHLSGWLWPLMITACAAEDAHRAALRALLPLARSPIGDRDNSDIAMRIIDRVHARRDAGDAAYHVREALRDDPGADLVLL